jgi:hypothetical protein
MQEYAEPNWIYNHFAVSNDTYLLMVHFGACMETQHLHPINLATSSVAWANNKVGSATVYRYY